jgi:predicted MFS family arabinose efflux permease
MVPRGRLGLFLAVNVLVEAGLFFHAFLYNFYLDGLGFEAGVMGSAQAAMTAGGLAAILPAGVAADRVGARRTFFGAVVLSTSGLAVGAVAQERWLIYAAAAVAGGGAAAWRVSMGPLLMALARPGERARAFSRNVALLVGAGAVFIAASGALADALGTRAALLVGAGMTALGGVAFALVNGAAGAPGPDRARVVGAGSVPRLPPALFVVAGLVAFWMVAPALVAPFFNLYFLREHGLGVDRIGMLFGVTHAVTAIAVFASGELATRFGPRRILTLWTIIFVPVLFALTGVAGVGLAVVLYALQGFVWPAANPLVDQILFERVEPARHGTVSSLRNGAMELAGVTGAALGGAVLEATSFGRLFGVAGAVGACAGAALWIVLRAWSRRTP